MKSERYRSFVAAYVMMLNDKNEILLARRTNTEYREGFYDMPAGHLEEGETLREAAVRELLEETGVKAAVEDFEFVEVLHRKSTRDREYIDFFFKVKRWQGEPSIQEPDRCDDMRWFSLDALPDNIVPHQKYVLSDRAENRAYREVGWKGDLDA